MKKAIALILSAVILLSVTACGGNVAGIDSDTNRLLEEAGIDPNEFAQYSEEQQTAILYELGIANGTTEKHPATTPKPAKPKISDVSGGGSYVVTVGDSMMWNYFELHYKDGVLVKIVTSFDKSGGDDEEANVQTVEGADACAQCGWFFIDYTQSPENLVNNIMDVQGYERVYVEKVR